MAISNLRPQRCVVVRSVDGQRQGFVVRAFTRRGACRKAGVLFERSTSKLPIEFITRRTV